jgi:hypothetical protein
MAGDTAYQEFFKTQLAKAGFNSPKDIPDDKKDDFFDMIDRTWKGEKKPGEKDRPGNSNESHYSNTRAGYLLSHHSQSEDFYRSEKGKKYPHRKGNVRS